MTIEERARKYATKLVGGEYEGGFEGDVWLYFYSKYVEIATEQLNEDLTKVCHALDMVVSKKVLEELEKVVSKEVHEELKKILEE